MRTLWTVLITASVSLGCGSTDGDSTGTGAGGGSGGSGPSCVDTSALVQACDDSPPAIDVQQGFCDASGWCWENPLPSGAQVGGVWGFSATDVWAATRDGIYQFDGSQWVVQDATIDGEQIWGAAPNDIWVVQSFGNQVLHFDGNAWQQVDTPGNDFSSIWGTAHDNVWLASYQGSVLRYDGATWNEVTPPPATDLAAVWSLSKDLAWVGTQSGPAYRWANSTWTEFSSALAEVQTIWGTSENDVYIGGSIDFEAAVMHFDGATLTPVTLPADFKATGRVSRIWGLGPNDIWIGTEFAGVAHLVNGVVTTIPSPIATESLAWMNAFWGTGAGDVWLAASASNNGGWFSHWDGQSWSKQGLVTDAILLDVWGSAWNDTWATGTDGTVMHYDGKAWTREGISSTTPSRLSGVWGRSACEVYVADENGTLSLYDGSAWSQVGTGLGHLLDLRGVPTGEVWLAAGSKLIRYDGSTFEDFVPPDIDYYPIRAVWASTRESVWTVRGPNVLHFDGTTWQTHPRSDTEVLSAIWGRSDTDIWVGGQEGTYHFDGAVWTTVSANSTVDFWGCGNDVLYSADYGSIRKLEGGSWTPTPIGNTPVFGLWGVNADHLLAVGGFGSVRRLGK